MKGITINNVDYLPASALAKQFKYTTDYIGQLCRAKKVDAQLVGRSWYVNAASLTAHKEGRYATSRSLGSKITVSESKQEEKGYKITLSRLNVEPVVTKNASKMPVETHHNFAKRIDWKPLKYEIDEAALLPQLREPAAPIRIKVDLADSSELAIKTSTKPTMMVAEELPTVSLKGKLKVSSIDNDFDEEEELLEQDVPQPAAIVVEAPVKKVLHHAPLQKNELVRPVLLKSIPKPQLEIASVTQEAVLVPKAKDTAAPYIKYSLLSVSFALSLLLLVVLFCEGSVVASAATYDSSISFSTESLTALWAHFSR